LFAGIKKIIVLLQKICTMKLHYFVLLVIVSVLLSCDNKTGKTPALIGNDSIYTVNLDDIKDNSEIIYLSSICKPVKTIIPETTDESLFGNIDKIQAFKDKIFIMDCTHTKSLFAFDTNGKFLQKYGQVGIGPEEYQTPDDFTVDTVNEHIFIMDDNKKVCKYDINTGQFLSSFYIQTENTGCSFIQWCNGKLYTDIRSYQYSKDNYLLQEINMETGKPENFYINISYNKGWDKPAYNEQGLFAMKLSPNPKYFQMFMDTVMSIEKDGVMPYLVLQSKNWVTRQDLENIDYLQLSSALPHDVIYGIEFYLENDNFISFRYMDRERIYTACLDKHTRTAKTVFFADDFLFTRLEDNCFPGSFKFADSKGCYRVLADYEMEMLFQLIAENKLSPALDKLDELKKLPEDANQIIFYYEYK
jgi:hypothetical protein